MREGRMAKAVAMLLVASVGFLSSGCFGKFQLTRKVYEVNRSMEEKYSRSALTWVLLIVPVYAVAGLLDFVVFNLIEFWSGQNPLDETASRVFESGERRIVMTVGREGGATVATLEEFRNGARVSTMRIRDDGGGTVTAALAGEGKAARTMTSRPVDDGAVLVAAASAEGTETARYAPASVEVWSARVSRAAAAALLAAAPGGAPFADAPRIPALAG